MSVAADWGVRLGLVSRVDRESRKPGRLAVFREDAPPSPDLLAGIHRQSPGAGGPGEAEKSCRCRGGGRQGQGRGRAAGSLTPGESRIGRGLPGKPGPRLGARSFRPRLRCCLYYLHAVPEPLLSVGFVPDNCSQSPMTGGVVIDSQV